jgi:hypothetical protein
MSLPNPLIAEGAGDGPGEELFALADAIAAVIGGSVAIEDLDARVLAYSTRPGQRIDELRRQGILGRRVPDQAAPQAERQQRQYRQVLAATGVVRLPGLAEDELPRARSPSAPETCRSARSGPSRTAADSTRSASRH